MEVARAVAERFLQEHALVGGKFFVQFGGVIPDRGEGAFKETCLGGDGQGKAWRFG